MGIGVTDPRQAEQIVERLENALGDSAFPSTYRRWGAQLLSNLRRPIDVAVIGAPGSGKTSLINMMLGRHDIPALPGFELVEVAYGPNPSIKLEFENGTIRQVDGPVVDPSLCEGAIRASVELPDPALLQQSFTELCLPEAPGQRESILRLACQNSAILVFCSENFGEPEQALWAKVPDEIKDRSFLVLTKADRLLMKGRLAQRISELEDTVTEGFFGLYPVATLQGIAARIKGRTTQMDLWETSGGREFCTSLERLVRLGRAEDLDNAQMLLGRVAGPTSRADGKSMGRTAPQNPKAGPAERQASAPDSSATEAGKALAGPDSHVLKNQLDQLQKCADEMLELFGQTGGTDPARIIEQCVEAMESLSDSLMADGVDTPEIRKVRDDAQEGQDILLLLRLEGDENAAADAVALMTQLKKEIFERLND